MTPSTYTAVGVGTTSLASALVYFSHWPLQPLTDAEAISFAGLIVATGGSVHGIINAWLAMKAAKKAGAGASPAASASSAPGVPQ